MQYKLTNRDIRTLKAGAIAAVAVVAFVFGMKWVGHWRDVRSLLASHRAKLQAVKMTEAQRAGLLSVVPVFEMPKVEDQQQLLFRDKFNEQLKKAGVRNEPLQLLPAKKSKQAGYNLLRLKCKGKCNFGQMLDLLIALKENPYLVGIDEMKIQCDPKSPAEKRQEIEFDLTVSTFVK